MEGGSLDKKFFFQSEHVLNQIWCQKFFPFTEMGTPPPIQGWISLPKNLRPGTPLPPSKVGSTYLKIWDLGTPPVNVNRQTPVKTVPSRRTTYAGGNKKVKIGIVSQKSLVTYINWLASLYSEWFFRIFMQKMDGQFAVHFQMIHIRNMRHLITTFSPVIF